MSDPPRQVVRVLPDIVELDKAFDYAVPHKWFADDRAERLEIGSIVRITLGPRRLRGWVLDTHVEPKAGFELLPLAGLTGAGPPAEILDLASWAAWRWAGHLVSLLRAASPPRVVGLPHPPSSPRNPAGSTDGLFYEGDPVEVLRVPPGTQPALEVTRAAARRGDALILVPTAQDALIVAEDLARRGVRVARGSRDWALAAKGATVVGTRTAAWVPMPRLSAVVVLDEHSEHHKSEYTPYWHARDVALERARRAGVPAVLVSPTPSLEALSAGSLRAPDVAVEWRGWPAVDVIDRRGEDPTRGGLFAEGLRERLKRPGRVVVVLNRKGRARLLACKSCGELVRSADGRVPMMLEDEELVAVDGSEHRPVVCASCGFAVLRHLRKGVTGAREELAVLVGEPVGEVTAATGDPGDERILIGTEAVLWRVDAADVVVFLDLDQELLAPRQRAVEQASALLARAARLLGGRQGEGRLVLQTRQPQHPVVQAVLRGDPQAVSSYERDRRKALGLPPYGAQAMISGAVAEDFVDALRRSPSSCDEDQITVMGPSGGAYLLRAARHEPLLDLLASTQRPAGRLKIEVDPLRA